MSGSGNKIIVEFYFLLYTFLNFLKSSTRSNIIWGIKLKTHQNKKIKKILKKENIKTGTSEENEKIPKKHKRYIAHVFNTCTTGVSEWR